MTVILRHIVVAYVSAQLCGSSLGAQTNRVEHYGEVRPEPVPIFTNRDEAVELMINDANRIASALHLAEKLPITTSDLTGVFVYPSHLRNPRKAIGRVDTVKYDYCFSYDSKFCFLLGKHQEDNMRQLRQQFTLWPIDRLRESNQGAYLVATQLLDAISMDVKGLNRDCKLHIRPMETEGAGRSARFLPLYDIYWTRKSQVGSVASVRLFYPTKTLLQLCVDDPKYNHWQPLRFTNTNSVALQTNVSAKTNAPRR